MGSGGAAPTRHTLASERDTRAHAGRGEEGRGVGRTWVALLHIAARIGGLQASLRTRPPPRMPTPGNPDRHGWAPYNDGTESIQDNGSTFPCRR